MRNQIWFWPVLFQPRVVNVTDFTTSIPTLKYTSLTTRSPIDERGNIGVSRNHYSIIVKTNGNVQSIRGNDSNFL